MSYETDDKMVSHPDHYKSGKFEVIDIIDEFTKDLKGTEAVCTANAIKYILRWKKKNGIQDVKKAIWYLQHIVDKDEEKLKKEDHAELDEWRQMVYDAESIQDILNGTNKKEANESVKDEESKLCAENHTNVAGVTVPDSQPWSSSEKPHICSNCIYFLRKRNLEPCVYCYQLLKSHLQNSSNTPWFPDSNWKSNVRRKTRSNS